MNVKVPLALLLILAAAVGYLLGTEKGRGHRDAVMSKIGERRSEVVDLTEDAAEAVTDTAEAAAPSS